MTDYTTATHSFRRRANKKERNPMNTLLIQLIPTALFFLSICVPVGIVVWIRRQRKNRRNPLTFQMLRAPGESISERIENLSSDIDQYVAFTGFIPLLCYSMYLSTRYVAQTQASPVVFLMLAVGFVAYYGFQLNKAFIQRHKEQLGLDCERAVGQELNQLMLDGYRVFHDVPADNFNIDHVVVGTNGVFAIETKGRPKPDRGRGQDDAKVIYDGQVLQFPTWREKEPLDQAKRQAVWLSDWLTKATGESVAAMPVLALPGWYIELKGKGCLIFNGKNPQFLCSRNTGITLTSEQIQRISHQLDQQCRTIAAQAYRR